MDDEDPHCKGQDAKGGQVQVETVGQPRQAIVGGGGAQRQALGHRAGQGAGRVDQQGRDCAPLVQKPLGQRDVDQHRHRRQVRRGRDGQALKRPCHLGPGQRLGRDQRHGAAQEPGQIVRAQGRQPRHRRRAGQGQGLHPQHPQPSRGPTLQHGRDGPALTPHRREIGRGQNAFRRHQPVQPILPQRPRRPGIGRPRLGVDRLHARPQRRRHRQPHEQHRQLQRMPPPV